ncbi:MAG TPA: hypothetical protein VGQ53_24900 [Chitinophagaceae bacterium]|nr:hypothetical protein [Chitinophagaceae bacterium]
MKTNKTKSYFKSIPYSPLGDGGKSLLNGKMGIYLLITNQVHVSRRHGSAEVVTVCMLLFQLDIPTIRGFESHSLAFSVSDGGMVYATMGRRFESCSPTVASGIAQWIERYTLM